MTTTTSVCIWPLGEGMRRRGDRDLVAVVCGFHFLRFTSFSWSWQLGIGMGFVGLPHLTWTPHRPSPFRTCQSPLHFTVVLLAQDNSAFSLPVGDYVSVCLPSLSRDRIIIKPEMTVLIGLCSISLAIVM